MSTERGWGLIRGPALLIALLLFAGDAAAQAAIPASSLQRSEDPLVSLAKFLGGGALGLAMHESGHIVFDVVFGANPGVKKVSYAGIPFFAITHNRVSPAREFAISSAGFWVQQATSEILLTRRPSIRADEAPIAKGVLAFNTLTSVFYAGAAFASAGPVERDTRGMALASGVRESWIGTVILIPATLDAARYFKPQSQTLRWASRAAKVAGVLLILHAR